MQTVSEFLPKNVQTAIQRIMRKKKKSQKRRNSEIRDILNKYLRGKFRALKFDINRVVFRMKTALGFKEVTITA